MYVALAVQQLRFSLDCVGHSVTAARSTCVLRGSRQLWRSFVNTVCRLRAVRFGLGEDDQARGRAFAKVLGYKPFADTEST